jgi:ATP-binding cassette subfamily B protein
MEKYSLFKEIGHCFHAAPGAFALDAAIGALNALVPTAQMLAFARFVDGALEGGTAFPALPLALVALLIGFRLLAGKASRHLDGVLELGLCGRFEADILKHCAAIDYRYMEDPDARALIFRATKDAPKRAVNGLRLALTAVSLSARMLGVVLVILSASPLSAALVCLLAAPFLYLAARAGRARHAANVEATASQRWYEALLEMLTGREQAADRALFAYGGRIGASLRAHYAAFRGIQVAADRRKTLVLEAGSVLTCVLIVAVIALLLAPLNAGLMSSGLFIALVAAAFELIEIMSWDFTELVSALVTDAHERRDFARFLELPARADALLPPRAEGAFESIALRGVKFKYPGTDRYILNGVDLSMRKGGRYAFVGLNGAGKSTLVKLMLGLYRDYEGEILLNGRELRTLSPDYIARCLAAVHQDFAKYQITLRENIAVGNLPDCGDAALQAAARAARVDAIADALPDGYDTRLGQLDAACAELSGGQWQRVAIARATQKADALIVLDEPTAALDPLAESRAYEDFARAQSTRTTVLISHRLGSTKLADEIFLLDGGVIRAAGRHEALMESAPLYRQMYENQRRWYV